MLLAGRRRRRRLLRRRLGEREGAGQQQDPYSDDASEVAGPEDPEQQRRHGRRLTYTIRDGDTLAGIASRLGIALDDLLAANPGLDPGTLRAGQTIKLPQNAEAPPAAATATPGRARDGTIGDAHGGADGAAATGRRRPRPRRPPHLTRAANPAGHARAGGDRTPSSVGQSYTVLDGDFPAKIAEKFGIAVEDLLAANPGINPTDLHIGDVIIIPPKRP